MSYQEAKKKYAALGVDTEKAIRELKKIPVSRTPAPSRAASRQPATTRGRRARPES